MDKVDNPKKINHNTNNFLFIGNSEETIKIDKKDIKFRRVGGHKHHYKPDFSDEWDEAIALKCVIGGCAHGRMHPKKGKKFMEWLEVSRKSPTPA